ncbi:hypothetical protein [Sporosarcina globispora]|uniref:hypothetical protein n=1 Tax=Sporosarcina globispora TaxID=1459 RepID=UPI000AAE11EE|nr:hypothetical protein [Sporosarcina globispora]
MEQNHAISISGHLILHIKRKTLQFGIQKMAFLAVCFLNIKKLENMQKTNEKLHIFSF